MQYLRPIIDQLRGRRVLVVGDVMVDEYLKGDVSRISPEAPVPVLEVRSHEFMLGGAANAAANIQALGGVTTLVGVVGQDDTAGIVRERLAQQGIGQALVTDLDRPTIQKTRLVAQGQQIVRVDRERRHPVADEIAAAVRRAIDTGMRDAHAVVISDYAKGVVTAEIAQHAIRGARAGGIPVVVDPKQRSFAPYAGATVITPNLYELEAASPGGGVFQVERAAASLLSVLDGSALLVTRSAEGMTLFRTGRSAVHAPAMAKEVFDVTGAGDTVVATVALALAARVALEQAIELASVAAAISVSKRGTSTVSPTELASALDAA
jgi:D-beta-D-heptose 7-phosphate kinase/D-beta-D-heptose 1-phosphate adenosyltransferase